MITYLKDNTNRQEATKSTNGPDLPVLNDKAHEDGLWSLFLGAVPGMVGFGQMKSLTSMPLTSTNDTKALLLKVCDLWGLGWNKNPATTVLEIWLYLLG